MARSMASITTWVSTNLSRPRSALSLQGALQVAVVGRAASGFVAEKAAERRPSPILDPAPGLSGFPKTDF